MDAGWQLRRFNHTSDITPSPFLSRRVPLSVHGLAANLAKSARPLGDEQIALGGANRVGVLNHMMPTYQNLEKGCWL